MSEHKNTAVGTSSGVVVISGNSSHRFRRSRLAIVAAVFVVALGCVVTAAAIYAQNHAKAPNETQAKSTASQNNNPQSAAARKAEIKADQAAIDAVDRQPTNSNNPDAAPGDKSIIQLPLAATGGQP